jgi:hypothetical protein
MIYQHRFCHSTLAVKKPPAVVQMACSQSSVFPQILIHQATDTLGNVVELSQLVNSEGVSEVVSATFGQSKTPKWTIPINPDKQ